MNNEIKVLEDALIRLKELNEQKAEQKSNYQLILDKLESIEEDLEKIKAAFL